MELYKFKLRYFRCTCGMHNKENAVDSAQLLLYRS